MIVYFKVTPALAHELAQLSCARKVFLPDPREAASKPKPFSGTCCFSEKVPLSDCGQCCGEEDCASPAGPIDLETCKPYFKPSPWQMRWNFSMPLVTWMLTQRLGKQFVETYAEYKYPQILPSFLWFSFEETWSDPLGPGYQDVHLCIVYLLNTRPTQMPKQCRKGSSRWHYLMDSFSGIEEVGFRGPCRNIWTADDTCQKRRTQSRDDIIMEHPHVSEIWGDV